MEGLDVALRLAGLGAQIAIPIAIFLAGRLIARAQYMKSMLDMFNEFNKVAIASPENIRVVRDLMGPVSAGRLDSEDDVRKAYLGFIILNGFMAFYFGAKHGLLDKRYQKQDAHELLKLILHDAFIYELSQTGRGYHREFRELCKAIREGIPQDAPRNVSQDVMANLFAKPLAGASASRDSPLAENSFQVSAGIGRNIK